MGTIWQDLRYAARTLRRRPGFTLAVVVTLGLGIGANTAVFSMINGVLLRPLPYQDGDDLVVLRHHAPRAGIENVAFSVPEVVDYRQAASIEGLVEYHTMWFNLLDAGEPERVQTGVVSAEFFDVLGLSPQLGRAFLDGDDDPGAEPVLVLSDGYWRRRFDADPRVVGRTVEMNDRVHTIVGVLPPVPQYPQENDVYMPTSACPFRSSEQWIQGRHMRALTVFGRVAPGAPIARVRADLSAINARMQQAHPEDYPEDAGYRVAASPLREELTRNARPTLLVLVGVALFVLLIACANVANLTLARLVRREGELALRSALGAGRGRLTRQLLTESALLGLAGGALGLVLAAGGLDLLQAFAARFTPRAHEIGMDLPVLLFTLVLAVGTGLAFGSVPALLSRTNLVTALKEGARSGSGSGSQRARAVLIVAQLAVSFVLLVGAGLMVRSLWKLQRVDPGFDTENVLTMTVDLDWSKYAQGEPEQDNAARLGFFQRVLQEVRSQPGVVSAAFATDFPLDGGAPAPGPILIEGRVVEEGRPQAYTEFRIASPDYFRTIGVPRLRGRTFTEADHARAPVVVVINQSMARRHFGDADPIGRRISTDDGQTWDTVVGVIGDVKQYGLDRAPVDEVYYSLLQTQPLGSTLLLRTASNPMSLARRVREVIRGIDSEQPVAHVRTLEQARRSSLDSPRLTTVLLGLFAALALAISATGIAGLLAFSVSQRTHEIGVRVALGARRESVVGLVVRQALVMVLAGVGLGILAAGLLGRLMSGLLFEVRATDPATFAAVALVLCAVGLAACWAPARRATGISPLTALRTT